ncbi:Hypothetical protein NTJ_10065 [Nesidiocoris tenuis]|uniref:Uncharacterized protein n=1 Tax=Nesidiocoris tenuis TaxID=355587 RepID=A0ABN7AYK4_9HEMI|nr:Hypothetical protein NTJ_10065 [Nesidiocoris tenuis]
MPDRPKAKEQEELGGWFEKPSRIHTGGSPDEPLRTVFALCAAYFSCIFWQQVRIFGDERTKPGTFFPREFGAHSSFI